MKQLHLSGSVNLPASKSISNRALVLRHLSQGKVQVENISDAEDTQRLLKALEDESQQVIDAGAGGTTIRFLLAALAAEGRACTLTGSERLRERPIAPLVEALNQFGARIEYTEKNGFPPVRVVQGIPKGNLHSRSMSLPADISSQFVSAMLLIAPFLEGPVSVELQGHVVSRPYLEMTVQLLRQVGVEVHQQEQAFTIAPAQPSGTIHVEADWSSASYFLALAAAAKKVRIRLPGLSPTSLQGDSHLLPLLQQFGLTSHFTEEGLVVEKVQPLQPSHLEHDLEGMPDLAQTLVVLCTLLQVPFHFTGLGTLRIKETDRLHALQQELAKLGTRTETGPDWIASREFGPVPQQPVSVRTYHDHRMAMSFALFSALYPQVSIENPEVVSKSFPRFWKEWKRVVEGESRSF